jgi:lipoprotein-anchoring transpeptidase ErfK/SrfK
MPTGFEPAAAGTRPYYPPGTVAPGQGEDGMRPPMPIGPGQQVVAPGQVDPGVTGAVQQRYAALPPDVRPETGPVKALPPQFQRTLVDYRTKEPAGTIIVDTPNTYLYLVLGNGKAMRYGVGVGREGFTWTGAQKVTRMAEWPDWHPPEEMIERQPYLPRFMAGGPGNPMGARRLSRQHGLSHPRHQSAVHDRLVRVLGLHPSHQRGRPGPLHPRQGRHPRGGPTRRQAASNGVGAPVGGQQYGAAVYGHRPPAGVDGALPPYA